MSKHHPFSPSSLERRMLCPGSYLQEKDLPEVTSPESQDGTRLHEIFAKAISLKEGQSYMERLDEDDAEMVYNVMTFAKHRIPPRFKVYVEQKLSYREPMGKELYYGTADVLAVDEAGGEGIVIDWKTGYMPVTNAEDNLQGAGYALAAMQEFQIKAVTVYFYNPRLKNWTTHTFDNWQKIFSVIVDIIHKASMEKPPLVPGEKQCKYCKAALQGSCPMLLNKLEIYAGRPAPVVADLPDEQLTVLYEQSKILKTIFESIEKELKKRASENGVCGEYKVKTVPGARQITDINKAFELSGLTAEDFIKCCSVSVPTLEKTMIDFHYQKAKEDGLTKKDLEGWFSVKMDSVISNKEPSKRLVKAS